MLIVKNGRIINPKENIDEIGDIFIKNGKIVPEFKVNDETVVIDAAGLVVAPGLVDVHVHLRDPGQTYKEDIITGAKAAAAGGVTTMLCMPNTKPAIDSIETVKYVLDRAKDADVNVLPFAAVTAGQNGEQLTDMKELLAAGAAAFSDDGIPIDRADIMRDALIMTRELGSAISSHCEDAGMVQNYAVNEGRISEKLGIPGRPAIAEEIMVCRDIMLAGETGGHVHIAHVSTKGSVDIIREAKARGIHVTAETCPQYFSITEELILEKGTLARVNPPLRTMEDVIAIIEGLSDGTIDAIVTDHAPHSTEEKQRDLTDAPSGMIGLETSLALTLTKLYHNEKFTINDIIKFMSTTPSEVFNLGKGSISIGSDADIVIFDPDQHWIIDPEKFRSKARNTPFGGMAVKGRVKYTIVSGEVVYKED